MDDEPGLFDLPDQAPSGVSVDRSQRGRNRETWILTATADVTITDAAALHAAAARAGEKGVTIATQADPGARDLGSTGPDVEPASDAFGPLAWLLWPTDGQDAALGAAAFRVLAVASEVVAGSEDRGTVSWKVTAKLTDVNQLRRLAAQAHPEEAAAVADSLATAWKLATDPFAPLRSIPGIAWRPGRVDVEHLRARASRQVTSKRPATSTVPGRGLVRPGARRG